MLRRRPSVSVSRTRAFLFALALGLGAFALTAPVIPESGDLTAGSTAPQTLVAPNSATYQSEALTELDRQEAADGVAPVYPNDPDPAVRDEQLKELNDFLAAVRAIRQKDGTAQQRLEELNKLDPAPPLSAAGRTAILNITADEYARMEQTARNALTTIMASRVAQPADGQPQPQGISTPAQAVEDYIAGPAVIALNPTEKFALQDLLQAFVKQNVKVDGAATEAARKEARDAVQPTSVTYTRGQVIAGQGARLGEAEIEALRETGYLESGFDLYRLASDALLSAGFACILGLFTYLLQPFSTSANRRMLVTGAVILGSLVAVRAVLPVVLPDQDRHFLAFAVPVAAAAMVAVSFGDLPFAAIVAVLVGLFAATIGASTTDLAGADYTGSLEAFELAMAYVVGGLAGALTLHRAERLARFALSAVSVALATGAVMAAFWLATEPRDSQQLPWILLAAGTAGLLSAVITVGCFVVLSLTFGVTTRLQLMELTQAEHPLLHRLQEEAPGTYHHSMMVAALAERAAAAIGADALVARVGSYYHDIGKLAQPGYYIENMLDDAPSPHDTLRPEESARYILDHVTSGLEIARRHRLPGVVRDFIPQHHGTRLVTYFYRRAAQNGGEVDSTPFRYQGPRPQSKEAAIVMLADSCEALVRASQQDDRARSRLDELVDSVFAERLAEGQLDDCDITMRELQQVAASFKATLRAVYHPRILYPSPAPEEIAQLARNAPADAANLT